MNEDFEQREEHAFRTHGRDCCHWCALRPQAWVWGPYGTRVCDYCQQMIANGRARDVVEEAAARLTVRGTFARFRTLDEDHWRDREHALMTRWLVVRTDCQPIKEEP